MRRAFVALFLAGCTSSAPPPAPPLPDPDCTTLLSWTAPTEREDGTLLHVNELEKFTIYVSQAPGQRAEDIVAVIDIPDNYLVEWSISENDPGTHWYYMTATDLDGLESAFSNERNKGCA